MNFRTMIVDNESEVTDGEIIDTMVLSFAADWMPADAARLNADELAERIATTQALNGKLQVTVLLPEDVNRPSEWEARGDIE